MDQFITRLICHRCGVMEVRMSIPVFTASLKVSQVETYIRYLELSDHENYKSIGSMKSWLGQLRGFMKVHAGHRIQILGLDDKLPVVVAKKEYRIIGVDRIDAPPGVGAYLESFRLKYPALNMVKDIGKVKEIAIKEHMEEVARWIKDSYYKYCSGARVGFKMGA